MESCRGNLGHHPAVEVITGRAAKCILGKQLAAVPLTEAEVLGAAPGTSELRGVGSHLDFVHHATAQSLECHFGLRGWHEPLCWREATWVRVPFMTRGSNLTLGGSPVG